MQKRIHKVENKLQSFTERKESLREMRSELLRAKLELNEESTARRHAEDRCVVTVYVRVCCVML